jgi:hypothetical protein
VTAPPPHTPEKKTQRGHEVCLLDCVQQEVGSILKHHLVAGQASAFSFMFQLEPIGLED